MSRAWGAARSRRYGPSVRYAILTALVVRLMVVAFVYRGFLDPGRDHWEFGYETGMVARSIVTGHGFGNPYWGQTGPTALITPVFPYLFASVFSVLGIKTEAAALAVLALNSLFSALTCVPIFFVAKKTVGIRAANFAVWIWAFYPVEPEVVILASYAVVSRRAMFEKEPSRAL